MEAIGIGRCGKKASILFLPLLSGLEESYVDKRGHMIKNTKYSELIEGGHYVHANDYIGIDH